MPRLALSSAANKYRLVGFDKKSHSKRFMSTAPAKIEESDENKAVGPVSTIETAPSQSIFGIEGYTWYPIVALGATYLIGHELFFLDERLFIAIQFYGMMYYAYVAVREDLMKGWEETVNKEHANSVAIWDLSIDRTNREIFLAEFSLGHADDLRLLAKEEERVAKLAVAYQNSKHKIDAKELVLAKLNTIRGLEDEERRLLSDRIARAASEYVRKSYAALPAAAKQYHVEWAINNIATEKDRKTSVPIPDDDPVRKLFADFLKQKHDAKSLGLQSQVARFMAKPAAH